MKKVLYDSSDVRSIPENPGTFPFTRGIHPGMYTKKIWTMRQYAGFGDAVSSNLRYKFLLSQGSTGLSIAFDLPTQMGYDSDHLLANGEVGRVGVAISSLEDMEILLEGLPLDAISTSMTINATASILLSLYITVAERRGIDWKKLKGTIQNDVLKEYIARGTYIFPPKASLKITSDIFDFCRKEVPEWNSISISGYHIREAGSTAIQEIAFTLANGLAYVDTAIQRGLKIDDFAPRLSFFFNVHNDLLEEVAKFRAARKLWAKLIKTRYSPKDSKSLLLRFHAQTAGSTLIATQADTNVVRVTLQCLAAALGGAQSIHTNSKDEALGLPTEEAAKIAIRTQQILAFESGITETADPLGGSYAIEVLTDELEKSALQLIEEMEKRGGVVACIESHWQQNLIQEAAYQYQKEIEQKKRIIVGINQYTDETYPTPPVLSIDSKIEEQQKKRLAAFKQKRNRETIQKHEAQLVSAAKEDKNLVPVILDAVRNHVTLGEVSSALEKVFGRYKGG